MSANEPEYDIDATVDSVEPQVIRPPLHQYFTRDWRFWGAVTALFLVLGTVVALVVTGISTTQQEGQVSDLTRSVSDLTEIINNNDDAARCRSELAAEVNEKNVDLQVVNAQQNVALDNALIASYRDDVPSAEEFVAQLEALADKLALSAEALAEAVVEQQKGLTSCG